MKSGNIVPTKNAKTRSPSLHKNHEHSKFIPALRRISGQIKGIEKMLLDERYCPDVLTQTRAVRAALKSLEAKILENHLKSCVTQAFQTRSSKEIDRKVKEMLDLFIKS